MFLRTEYINAKLLIGLSTSTSLIDNKTPSLWSSFMPNRSKIENRVSNDLLSVALYPNNYFNHFNPATVFERWATAEVTSHDTMPAGMEPKVLPAGEYAVFLHKGPASTGAKTFQYILQEWLPHSLFTLDSRPHFEVIGAKYKHEAADSEEEIWIPIKPK